MIRFFYSVCFGIFSLFYIPSFFIKGKHKNGWRERFGFISEAQKEKFKNREVYWVHAVSVGEVSLGLRLIHSLKKKSPNAHYLLTTTTVAGREVAEKLKDANDSVLFFPVDYRSSVRRFITTVKPKAVFILETEIWPNLIDELSERKIPIFIVNGRISDKSLPHYQKLNGLLQSVLRQVTLITVQDEEMKRRYLLLGAQPHQVQVTGNMKFDWLPTAQAHAIVDKLERFKAKSQAFYFVAGSTHEGEEVVLLDVLKDLNKEHPELKLILAPRHLNRLEAIEREIKAKALSYIKLGSEEPQAVPLFLLDQMGVLAQVYRVADVVFIGGSLVPYGGHNPVEAAFFEKPVLFGPYMNNFKEIANRFMAGEAAKKVSNAAELKALLKRWILNHAEAIKVGQNGKSLIAKHAGATDRNAELAFSHL